MDKKPHIIIVGAGFGGVYTAKRLFRLLGDSADITIISRDNYFLFTPLLHEVATGSLSPRSIVESVPEIFRKTNVHFVQTEVKRIDLAKKCIETGHRTFFYDYVVISTGAETNTYGTPGVAEHAYMLKTLSDAMVVRRRMVDNFKSAATESDPAKRKKLLSFAVIGGGPTGVELVAELHEFACQVAESYYARALNEHEISVTLIAASPALVPQFSKKVQDKAHSVLFKKGVEILLDTAVSEVSADGVSVKDAHGTRFIPVGTTVWVAGVKASMPEMDGSAHIHKSGRLMTNGFLQVEGHGDAFALGDGAILPMKEGEPPVPQLAQAAEAEANVVARNISIMIEKGNPSAASPHDGALFTFAFRSKGMLLSLGFGQAAGEIYGLHLFGPFMWFLWRTIYLFKFNSWRKRFSIAFEWTAGLFSPRDISEL